MRFVVRHFPFIVLSVGLVLTWEVAARLSGSVNFPPVSTVLQRLADNRTVIATELVHTLRRCGWAFLLAMLIGLPLGIVLGRVRWIGRYIEPLVDMLRPLPPPAIAPVVMLFAGTGDGAKIFVIGYAAIFPILIHAIDGVRGLHPMYGVVSRAVGLSTRERMMLVDLPAALPVMMTGVRLAVSTALLVSVVAEMLLSTDGIGIYLFRSQEHFRIADGLAGIAVLALVGWCVNAGFLWLDRRLLAWHHATAGRSAQDG